MPTPPRNYLDGSYADRPRNQCQHGHWNQKEHLDLEFDVSKQNQMTIGAAKSNNPKLKLTFPATDDNAQSQNGSNDAKHPYDPRHQSQQQRLNSPFRKLGAYIIIIPLKSRICS
uniref:Uncharacterized protein n=1 Tax=Kalanchoe fedtschenkoi TaxID=63787 RepID=A0A7N1A1H2_KALFE